MKAHAVLTAFFIFLLQGFFATNTSADKHSIGYALADGDWYPIIYKAPDSMYGYEGLFIDILHEIFTNHVEMKFHVESYPWKRAQKHVKDGKADFLITIPTEARQSYSIQSTEPIFQLYLNVYTYKGHEKIEAIKKIKTADDILRLNLVPVSNLGNGWHKENIDTYGIKTHYIMEDRDVVKFLAAKRADIMIDAVIPMNYNIKELGLVSKIEQTDVRFGPVKFLSKKSNYIQLMAKINGAIRSLREDGVLDKIRMKYLKQN